MSKVDELKDEAQKLSGDPTNGPALKAAFAKLVEASRLDPNDADVWFALGAVLDEAETEDERYVTTEDLRRLVGEGIDFAAFNQVTCWNRAVALRPSFVEAWYRMGRIHDIANDAANAIRCFERVVDLSPHHLEAWCKLGGHHHAMSISGDEYDEIEVTDRSRLDRAASCYEEAIRINGKDAGQWEAFYWLAEISLLRKNEAAALQYFDQQVAATNDNYCKEKAQELRAKLGL